MTLEQLQAERDKILKQMSQPEEMRSGDDSLRNRSLVDLTSALANVDAEIAKLQQDTGRTFTIQTSRGI